VSEKAATGNDLSASESELATGEHIKDSTHAIEIDLIYRLSQTILDALMA
jgi:hypothetical protein